MKNQPFLAVLDQVRQSGKPYINSELCAFLDLEGTIQPRFFDMIHQPIQHEAGITDSIFIVAFDITKQVTARKELEVSEALLRLAAMASNMSTWSLNLADKVITYDAMFAAIVGWNNQERMTYAEAIGGVRDVYRQKLLTRIDHAVREGKAYDLTYLHQRFNDGNLVWLRAIGIVATDDAGGRIFSGIITKVGGG